MALASSRLGHQAIKKNLIDRNPIKKKKIFVTLNESDQAIIYRALSELSRSTQSDGFKQEVLALRKCLENEGKKP